MKNLRLSCLLLAVLAVTACKGNNSEDSEGLQPGDVFAVTGSNRLISFAPSMPSILSSSVTITGVTGSIVGIDFRPANGQLYVLSNDAGTGRLYTLNIETGAAALASALVAPAVPDAACPGGYTALSGGQFGVDFNPVPDRLRVVSNTGQNLRINVDTGVACMDGAINPAGNQLVASAYTNAFGTAGVAGSTTLFGVEINASPDRIVIQAPPNDGTLANTAPPISLGAGIDATDAAFDIDGRTGFALAALTLNGTAALYGVNLVAGSPTFGTVVSLGAIGSGEPLRGLAIPVPSLPVAFAVTATNQLVSFSPLAPQTVAVIGPIAPLQAGESVRGIDFRPATGDLYALGSSGRIYRVNPSTGAVLQSTLLAAVAPPSAGCPGGFAALGGTLNGVDFNPVADRLRVVSDSQQNLRINPDDGVTCNDAAITPGESDLVASAYASNFAGTDVTTLYGIDVLGDRLVIQSPPNDGTIANAVAGVALGVDATNASFDIAGGHNGLVLAAMNVGGSSNLYRISLTAGTAAQIGATPIGGATPLSITGLAIQLAD